MIMTIYHYINNSINIYMDRSPFTTDYHKRVGSSLIANDSTLLMIVYHHRLWATTYRIPRLTMYTAVVRAIQTTVEELLLLSSSPT